MYHILAKMKDGKNYFEYNIEKTEEEIIKEYIIPYVDCDDFFLESGFVNRRDIGEIIVKNVNEKIERIRDYLQNQVAINVIYFYTNETALENDICGKNIVSDLIKKLQLLRAKEKKSEKKLEIKSEIITQNNKIFIVHGHDIEMRETVARFVEKIGLEAVILYEQTNGGKTIIEKIEENTDVRYGIILYSPCDHGKSQKEEKLKNRPRQNVVLEHGYLMAKLGRKNVIALTKGELELPSDLLGIINPNYDLFGYWKFKIAKELKENGLKIDMNKID
ncbi:TIR domain-containing protein [Cetobacterium sp.]|uniref:TIR domain-containing protein n=1 Tax=Cetobacterium sp. TaxID=2071632 RepID=UPI003EE5E085